MSELVGIREAARRLNVSDTAVRKAIAVGRVQIAARHPENDRPLLAWPDCEADWRNNSDAAKRSHVGPTGTSERRTKYSAGGPVAPVEVPAKKAPKPRDEHPEDPGGDLDIHNGLTLNEAKTIQAIYSARQARLDYEKDVGKVVDADQIKIAWSKLITAAKTRIMGIPAACKSRAADLPLPVVAIIESVCREALEDLANGRD